jgi:addiction module HigA family antidote
MTIRIEDLATTDFSDVARGKKLPPIHPGEILFEDFLTPLGISQYAVAKAIAVSPRRINEIVHGQRSITADTGVRLSRFFGLNDGFWVGLQADYDVAIANETLAETLKLIPRFKPTVA